ncbi:MAG TPA: hypothetical protein ENI87_15540 [bacterium]|nr:hypothetical protein [bacterium]
MRVPHLLVLSLLSVACRDPEAERGGEATQSLLAIQAQGCVRCHDVGEPLREALAPPARSLSAIAAGVRPAAGDPTLAEHFAGEHAADIRAWLATLAPARTSLRPVAIGGGLIERGAALVAELGCRACHDDAELDRARCTDHEHLRAALRRPERAHVPLDDGEAAAIAAWLLRGQKQVGASAQGFAWECYELPIADGDLPDLDGHEPVAKGVATQIDTSVATRADNYALVFTTTVDVPATGLWSFATASDDGSWLWVDDVLVVDNAGLKPTTRRQGSVQLAAGKHQLRVVFTQAGGGAELRVTWQRPGGEEHQIPAARATASVVQLVPPPLATAAVEEAAVTRGRAAARAARCDRCHAVREAEFLALPPPTEPPPWARLAGGACRLAATGSLSAPHTELPPKLAPAQRLALALQADGCLRCHVRDGRGGLAPAVREQLTEVEDLGEEGMVPPDLTMVGRRLRRAWIARVVGQGHKARDYVRMRMPAFGADRGEQYAEWFAAVDAPGLSDREPEFDSAAVELGRRLVGSGGRNCVACHRVSGRAALGPQGMDLARQFERVRPAWFHDWLARPTSLRPNTRMPQLWVTGSPRDDREIAAIRVWSSLGSSAPLPDGIVVEDGSLRLEPVARPILHGAFLRGVSARALAVGTPARTHFAFDLVAPRLVWIWRGAFLDASGTWHGRAGKLLEPLGEDWQVVDDFVIEAASERRLLGQRRTEDGYPVLRVRCGNARYEDCIRPRFARGGGVLVRTIRCVAGHLELAFPRVEGYRALVAGQPAARHLLDEGQQLEIVYQW